MDLIMIPLAGLAAVTAVIGYAALVCQPVPQHPRRLVVRRERRQWDRR
jgi:hypothetical protein